MAQVQQCTELRNGTLAIQIKIDGKN